MMFEDVFCNVRMAAGPIADYLAVSIACLNQTYFKKGIMSQLETLLSMKHVPAEFMKLYKRVMTVENSDYLKQVCNSMIRCVRVFFSIPKSKYRKTANQF